MTEGEPLDLAPLEEILDRYEGQEGVVIPVLQQVQEVFGYLPRPALEFVSQRMKVPLSQIYGVATFYSQFSLTRRGRHTICQCDGTACHVRGSPKIIKAVEKELGIKAGQTTDDYEFTFEVVYCLGSCALAPVAVVDGQVVGHLTPERMTKIIHDVDGQEPGSQ
ncbi:MAG: NADH-quinone oxidoreductase subunit NuoE [Anaerolineae bacterium]|nr:NADH-quinone oxidoreductase subunit NuoE [Anaerolineae bacterium]